MYIQQTRSSPLQLSMYFESGTTGVVVIAVKKKIWRRKIYKHGIPHHLFLLTLF
jgi:hypothetical protein